MIFVGIDWPEAHHDVCVLDEQGNVLAKGRVAEGVEGLGRLHAMVAEHAEEPSEVVVASRSTGDCSSDCSSRRTTTSTRSTPSRSAGTGTATPSPAPSPIRAMPRCWPTSCGPIGQNHREVAGDTDLAEAIKVLGPGSPVARLDAPASGEPAPEHAPGVLPRALVALRSDLASHEACSILGMAPTPE